ncbi:MAG: thr operon leader peptide [Nitrosopumilus sp. B06]|nr:MAG: thr operon leader peptide [Nitrosopumilus sp. D6]RNJ78482.1 MAG: thr operon leader peptide [Nitrosopumilus sp. B06]
MNRYTVISIIAIAVIVAPFLYSGIGIFGAPELEYRWAAERFSFFALSNHGDVEFCNPLPFWIGFEKLDINVYYDSTNYGTFSVGSTLLDPISYKTKEGMFKSDGLAASQHIFMTMDHEFSGGAISLDPNRFVIITSVDTPILGFIPYTTSEKISGFDFAQMMSSKSLSC